MFNTAAATVIVPPKGISETNTLPLGGVKQASTSAINPAAIPLPSSPPPTNGHATSSFPNAISTSAAAAVSSPTPTDALPTLPSKKRTQRDRDGPAPDVASALNAAFGTNARAGAYYAGQLHRDGAEDGIESDDGDSDTGSRKKQRKGDTTNSTTKDKGKGKEKALERPTNAEGAYITQDQLMMGSLRNKNKKKGFKLSMANPIPRKIVFADDGVVNVNVNANSNANTNPNQHQQNAADEKEVEACMIIDVDADIEECEPHSYDHPQAQAQAQAQSSTNGLSEPHSYDHSQPQPQYATNGVPRLIPPSEIQARGELPPNMFVTSVDVEADVWGAAGGGDSGIPDPNSKRSKRKNRKLKQPQQRQEYDASQYAEDVDEFRYPPVLEDQGFELLDYSEDPQPPITALSSKDTNSISKDTNPNPNPNQNRKFDWIKAEKNWDTSTPLTSVEQVGKGGYVGWKVGIFLYFPFIYHPIHPLPNTGTSNKPPIIHTRDPPLRRTNFCFILLSLHFVLPHHPASRNERCSEGIWDWSVWVWVWTWVWRR